jgi:CheY-like chemotaxis protein
MSQNKKPIFVLIADDDPKDHLKMQMALTGNSRELKIDSVSNGMELLDHLIKIKNSKKDPALPDLIITDLYMPFAGALHVLKQIKNHPDFKHIPIYVFSANNDSMIRNKVMENGAIEFHQKPGEFTLLQNIVAHILDKVKVSAIA